MSADHLKMHDLTKKAVKVTGRTFEELRDNLRIEPGEGLSPQTWAMTWPGSLIDPENITDVHPFAVLCWFYSDDSWSNPDARELAANYLMLNEYAVHGVRGAKLLRGAEKGHEYVHGTPVEKKARWAQLQSRLEELMETNRHLSLTDARQRVAKERKCSFSTVRRHTHDPRKTRLTACH